jgi:agmatine/peptidylarginine deiminase
VRTTRNLALLALLPFFTACTPPLPDEPVAAASAVSERGGVERIVLETATPATLGPLATRPMPAFRTAAESMLPGAADQSDDYRIAYPEYFAATVPPAPGAYRPYGEWETMTGVWTTYSSGMPSTPAVRRMFAEQTIHFVRDSKPTVTAYVVVANQSIGDDFVKAIDSYGITAAEKQHVKLVTLPNQTIWMMDYSGFPLVHKSTGALAFADWVYYQPRHLDDALGVRIPRQIYDANVYKTPFPFEGGNIQADGVERCATTNRALSNTGYSALKVRNLLARYAGCKTTYIVKDVTDDGTGHIDMFFKWLDTHTVLFGEYGDSVTADIDGDGNAETVPMPGKVAPDYAQTFATNKKRMDDNAALFAAEVAADGKKFVVPRLPMMTRFKDQYGDLPRTFINSTFANGVNVYPSYATSSCQNPNGKVCKVDADCSSGQHCAAGRCTNGPVAAGCDELVGCSGGLACKPDALKKALTQQAQAAWQAAMPGWKHVGLRADTIAMWSGAIHCITRTIPAAKAGKAVPDALCIGGQCNCVPGGATQACSSNATCFGPTWRCPCNICKGACAGSGKACTDDADCSSDGQTVPNGACQIDPTQACYGSGGGSGGCGNVSFEGVCQGKQLQYCDGGLKSQSCQGCCGWDGQSGYFNCLSGAACNGCVPECSLGQGGCSSQATHEWTCQSVGGCPKRVYSLCNGGCDPQKGTCASGGGGGSSACPGGTDAGSTDTTQPDTAQPDTTQPDTTKPDSTQPDTAQPDTTQPDTTQPDTAQPDIGTCTPACAGKQCGPDGCGGTCSTCPFGLVCSAAGQCVAAGTDTSAGDAAADSAGGDDAGRGGAADGTSGDTGEGVGDAGTARGADGSAGDSGAGGDGTNVQGDAALGDTGTVWNPPPREAPMCTAAGPGAPARGSAAWLFGLAALALLLRRRARA